VAPDLLQALAGRPFDHFDGISRHPDVELFEDAVAALPEG
jgi:hypothetical protein